MKKLLQSISVILAKLESLPDRRQALETEQRELPAKIRALTTAVAGAQTEKIDDLHIAKARQELLSYELLAAQSESDDLINELRNLVASLSPELAKIYNQTRPRIEKLACDFLEKHLDNSFQIKQIAGQITTNSKELSELEKYKTVFGGIYGFNQSDSRLVESRAKYAIANLKNYE
jgi:DNA repair exonuclease SbcCD ATPase subunit